MDLSFGKKSLLVIDAGHHTLKMGVGQMGVKGRSVRLSAVYTVPTGATHKTTHDELNSRHAELIAEVIKRHNITAKHVGFIVPGRSSFVRQLRVPRVSGDRLQRLVQYEARQQIPFPVEDIQMDSHVFDSNTPELGVALVAIRKTVLNQYCDMLSDSGLVPDTIDVGTLDLFNAYYPTLKEEDAEDVVALVDLGASTTDIVVCRQKRLEFIRSAPQAGNQLTKALCDHLGLDWEAAEETKIQIGSLDPSIDRQTDPLAYGEDDQRERVKVFLSKSFESITAEIRRTLDFYVSQPDGEPIGQIILTGGTSLLPGVAEFIEDRLGLPCVQKSPFDNTSVSIDLEGHAELAGQATNLIGFCQRNIADTPMRMNFLPPVIVKQKEFEKRRTLLVIEAVLLAFFIWGSVLSVRQQITVFNAATDSLETNLDGPGDTARKIRHYIDSTKRLEQRFDFLRDIARSRGVISQTLAEIADELPLGETWLTTIDIDTTRIRTSVRGARDVSMGMFKDRLQQIDRLRNPIISNSNRLGAEGISFNLVAEIEKDPSPEISKLRQQMEDMGIEYFEISLTDLSQPPGSRQLVEIRVVLPMAMGEEEQHNVIMDVLRAQNDANIGFQEKNVQIVFQNVQRMDAAKLNIKHSQIESLLQGTLEIKELTMMGK